MGDMWMNRCADEEQTGRWMEWLTHLPTHQLPLFSPSFFVAKWIPAPLQSLAACSGRSEPPSPPADDTSCLVYSHHGDTFHLARKLFGKSHVMPFWPRRHEGKSPREPSGKFSSLKKQRGNVLSSGFWTWICDDEMLRDPAAMRSKDGDKSLMFWVPQSKNIERTWVLSFSLNHWINQCVCVGGGQWKDQWMDGWMDGRIGIWMNEWMDGWVDGWKSEWINKWIKWLLINSWNRSQTSLYEVKISLPQEKFFLYSIKWPLRFERDIIIKSVDTFQEIIHDFDLFYCSHHIISLLD